MHVNQFIKVCGCLFSCLVLDVPAPKIITAFIHLIPLVLKQVTSTFFHISASWHQFHTFVGAPRWIECGRSIFKWNIPV